MGSNEDNPTVSLAGLKETEPKGAFFGSLVRGNKQIKSDRAIAIYEDAELIYKREMEDIQTAIKRLNRDRENMLDMNPDSAISLKLASDFDAKAFTAKDVEIGIKLRELNIKLEIMQTRYNYLFGGK